MPNDSLEKLHADLAAAHVAPTWKYVSEFVAREPRVSYRPWLWRWNDILPLLLRAGDLITPERGAERRSMEHVNPDLGSAYSTSHTIATAVQLVRAGERAPAHRHAAAAIRFAASSKGGSVYTKVEGRKLFMEENDLLLTPAGMWHEHANETAHDIVWLDALDFPLVNLLQASVFEPGEGPVSPNGDEGASALRYPWTQMHANLLRRRSEPGSPYDGLMLEYVNPVNSGPTLPTLSCRAQLLRAGEKTRAHRATSSTVYYVIAGEGATIINGIRFEWGQRDVFVVPTWAWHEHQATQGDAILFSITDEPALRMLGLYRELPFQPGDSHQTVRSTFTK